MLLMECFSDKSTQIATLVKKIESDKVLTNPNRPKVVLDRKGNALYFSRSVIPYVRDREGGDQYSGHPYYYHIGLYAYRSSVLHEITKLPPGLLERAESLEQLRWLENGYAIKTATTEYDTFGIDTPDDLQKAINSGMLEE